MLTLGVGRVTSAGTAKLRPPDQIYLRNVGVMLGTPFFHVFVPLQRGHIRSPDH